MSPSIAVVWACTSTLITESPCVRFLSASMTPEKSGFFIVHDELLFEIMFAGLNAKYVPCALVPSFRRHLHCFTGYMEKICYKSYALLQSRLLKSIKDDPYRNVAAYLPRLDKMWHRYCTLGLVVFRLVAALRSGRPKRRKNWRNNIKYW